MSIPFYGSVNISQNLNIDGHLIIAHSTTTETLQITHPRYNIGSAQYEGLTDKPGNNSVVGWNRIPSGLFTYSGVSGNQNGCNFINRPGGADWFNLLHINAYGPDTTNAAGVMQIAGDYTGRLFFRNGNHSGWYGDSTVIGGWREIIDSNGGQIINGALTCNGTLTCTRIESPNLIYSKQLYDGYSYNLNQYILGTCGISGVLSPDENISTDRSINTITDPGTYVMNRARGTTANGYPYNEACGLLWVVATLSMSPGSATYVKQYFAPAYNDKLFVRYTMNGATGWSNWRLILNSHPTKTHYSQHVSSDAYLSMNGMSKGDDIVVDLLYAGDDGSASVKLYWGSDKSEVGGKWSGWYSNSYNDDAIQRIYLNNAALPTTGFTWSGGATQYFKAHLWRVA